MGSANGEAAIGALSDLLAARLGVGVLGLGLRDWRRRGGRGLSWRRGSSRGLRWGARRNDDGRLRRTSGHSRCASGLAGTTITRLLVDLDAVDHPEGIPEGTGVVGNVFVASGSESRAFGVLAPDAASPAAAEVNVKNDLVLGEVVVEVARATRGETGRGLTPCLDIGLGGAILDILGDLVAREVPNGHVLVGPVHGVDTATVGVEAVTVVLVVLGGLTAAVVTVAVAAYKCGGLDGTLVGNLAAGTGVQSDGVGLGVVNTLDDVDLTTHRPVGAEHPESGPQATGAGGHVSKVSDEETLGEGLAGLNASRLTSIGRALGVVINTKVDGTRGRTGHTLGHGSWAVDILNETLSRVGVGEEVEFLEEVVGVVLGIKDILGVDTCSGEQSADACGEECR